ncbi:MAG TPA: glycosyltransferase family 9 protein, partial [Bacteroidales bacterium]|nr:glycosyltransferase family 9 protein [Bacteroidales bacterium]
YSLLQSASLIRQAKVVLTGDTGLMHIAAAFNKKIVTVWGNTVPEFGMYPYSDKNLYTINEVKSLPCRPCSKIGFNQCPKKHFNCMIKQDTSSIINQVKSFYE